MYKEEGEGKMEEKGRSKEKIKIKIEGGDCVTIKFISSTSPIVESLNLNLIPLPSKTQEPTHPK